MNKSKRPTTNADQDQHAKQRLRFLRPIVKALDLARAERDGLLVLFVALGLFIWVPIWTEKHRIRQDQAFWASLPIATQRWMDSIEAEQSSKTAPVLAPFDPNTATIATLVELGLSPAMAKQLDRYRSAGGRFKDAESLLDLYGFPQADYERLRPYVRIAPVLRAPTAERIRSGDRALSVAGDKAPVPSNRRDTRSAAPDRGHVDPSDPSTWRPYTGPMVDINQANEEELDALPGIGKNLARRATRFRERLGGFIAVDQFREVYGLDEAVFDHIQPHLQCSGAVHQLRLNTTPEDSLRSHPYIAPWIAERIAAYREEHHGFLTLDELQRIRGVTDSVYKRVLPYLSIGTWSPL